MNPLRLLILLVSLPLLLGGCGENVVNNDEIEYREGVAYLKGSENPYTGKAIALWENGQKRNGGIYKDGKMDGLWMGWYENGQKRAEANYKDGKMDGLGGTWHENGQKRYEANYKDGTVVGSMKFWNSKGESVDTVEEAEAE